VKIIVWESTDSDTPARWRFAAAIVTPMQGAKGKTADDFLPVRFQGPTAEFVTAQAEKFWAAELERFKTAAAPKPKKGAKIETVEEQLPDVSGEVF
jgi:hypothetical protein